MSMRFDLDELGLGAGKKARLHRILFQHQSLRFVAALRDVLAKYPTGAR